MTRTGRRPGRPDTKDAILVAARTLFAEVGYERASVRAIARRAGVDPALVHHYFGTKDELLGAAVELPIEIGPAAERAFDDRDRAGEMFARIFLSLWETPRTRERVLALLRAAVTHQAAAAILRTVITRGAVAALSKQIGLPDAELRAEIAATHMLGLAFGRYVLRIEPLASASVDDLVATVGPTLQRYLADPTAVRAGPSAGPPADVKGP